MLSLGLALSFWVVGLSLKATGILWHTDGEQFSTDRCCSFCQYFYKSIVSKLISGHGDESPETLLLRCRFQKMIDFTWSLFVLQTVSAERLKLQGNKSLWGHLDSVRGASWSPLNCRWMAASLFSHSLSCVWARRWASSGLSVSHSSFKDWRCCSASAKLPSAAIHAWWQSKGHENPALYLIAIMSNTSQNNKDWKMCYTFCITLFEMSLISSLLLPCKINILQLDHFFKSKRKHFILVCNKHTCILHCAANACTKWKERFYNWGSKELPSPSGWVSFEAYKRKKVERTGLR